MSESVRYIHIHSNTTDRFDTGRQRQVYRTFDSSTPAIAVSSARIHPTSGAFADLCSSAGTTTSNWFHCGSTLASDDCCWPIDRMLTWDYHWFSTRAQEESGSALRTLHASDLHLNWESSSMLAQSHFWPSHRAENRLYCDGEVAVGRTGGTVTCVAYLF